MRVVIQRVRKASVTIDGGVHASIGGGLLVLLGIEDSDGPEDVDWLSGKVCQLRIFNDENGVMNRSVIDTAGDVLVVSQFTLHASTKKATGLPISALRGTRWQFLSTKLSWPGWPPAWASRYRQVFSAPICWSPWKTTARLLSGSTAKTVNKPLFTRRVPPDGSQMIDMQQLTVKQAQQEVDEWIKTIGVRYFGELTNLGILMEEVGELSRIMVRKFGEQSFKASDQGRELADEMADVLWVLICLANQTGVDLESAFRRNMEKKTGRDADRHRQNPKLG